MRLLIAEDSQVYRTLLEAALGKCGLDLIIVSDGVAAWQALQGDDPPPLAVLDWEMPGMNGPELCRRIRQAANLRATHVILLTARDSKTDVVSGLDAGADDYVIKPFDAEELRARVQIGARIVTLQKSLADRVRRLEDALAKVHQLQGLLPICSYCKKVRDDKNYWQQVETYIAHHSDARFSHTVCPTCLERVKGELKQAAPKGAPSPRAVLREQP